MPLKSITKDNALLIIVDFQEKLCKPMDKQWLDKVVARIGLLCLYAKCESMPVLVTEQYPKGLGSTIFDILDHLKGMDCQIYEKVSFSCANDNHFMTAIDNYPNKKVILVGMETHICIYLSALGLIKNDFEVFIPQDGVIARDKSNHENGLQLMEKAGATITNAESMVFQMMGSSVGETFKKVSNYLKSQS